MCIFKCLISLLFLLTFCSGIYSEVLQISEINKTNLSDISIEFNNVIKIYKLQLKNDNIISPSYSGKNNTYYYFSFLDRNFKKHIISEIKSDSQQYLSKNDKIEYKINKFNIKDNLKTVKAFVSVIFNDTVEVQCSILKGKYGLWVQWPSQKEKDKWTKLFIIKDNYLKNKIEKEILEKYKLKIIDNDKIKNK